MPAAFVNVKIERRIPNQGVERQASGRQPRRVAIWKAQHMGSYVSIYKSHATQDHGLMRRFSTA
jgi:hypothetical protein